MNALSAFLVWIGKLLLDMGRAVGREEANNEANEEARRRIEIANAARADADEFASGELRDPNDRDNALR